MTILEDFLAAKALIEAEQKAFEGCVRPSRTGLSTDAYREAFEAFWPKRSEASKALAKAKASVGYDAALEAAQNRQNEILAKDPLLITPLESQEESDLHEALGEYSQRSHA